ncbi:MAG: hypothetical protein SangKO_013920 [Sandaracinaceae bacterium]
MQFRPVVLSILLCLGCDGAAPEDGGVDGGVTAPDSGVTPPYDAGPFERIPEAEAEAGRGGCAFGRGAMPWETVGEEFPIGGDIPIRHFIVLMQENRSFDHYFGAMPGVDGIPAGASNPRADGTPVEPFHTSEYCIRDVAHSWSASHRQWNDGANDGFVTTNEPGGERALGYLDDADLPFYWDLARTFAMSDHHFCSVLGPTWVNRFYMLSGTSFGRTSNGEVDRERIPEEGHHVIFEQLDLAGVSWGIYFDSAPFVFGGYPHYALRPPQRRKIHELDDETDGFFAALEAGTLPEVVFIDPTWDWTAGVDATDEHPPANPQRGQAWVREIVSRVMASDIWAETAIIVTYDEHGGFYDHVPPPEACHPGDYPSGASDGDFDRLGFRVPLIVVSPYARAGYVSPRVTDLSSIPRLLQARYLLPALTGRDANAWPMLDMFDFASPPHLTPPTLAEAPVDEARIAACHAAFPE